jgi:hypothetical protein
MTTNEFDLLILKNMELEKRNQELMQKIVNTKMETSKAIEKGKEIIKKSEQWIS